MARNRSWYYELFNRARRYEYTSYPYTDENLGRARVIKELKGAISELLNENEEQAAEIERLKGLLEKEKTSKEKPTKKRRITQHER